MQVLKYWRISDDKKSLILLPTKVGLEVIKKSLEATAVTFTDTIEKIDKSSLIAISINLGSEIRYLEYRIGMATGFYIYCVDERKFYINFPFEV